MAKRTTEREQFLSDLLVTAIEHAGYGFPETDEYVIEPDGRPAGTYAVISNRYEEDESTTYRVTIETMAHGIGVMRKNGTGGKAFWESDRTNAEDGDFDVLDALAVLESALFGEIVYG